MHPEVTAHVHALAELYALGALGFTLMALAVWRAWKKGG